LGGGGGPLGGGFPRVKAPPKYNGYTPVRDWLNLMEDYHACLNIALHHQVPYSALHLTDEVAATWRERRNEMQNMPTGHVGGADDPRTWPIFRREMTRMYGPADPTEQAKKDLKALTQTGSAEVYVREFNKIIARMPLGQMNTFHKIESFKEGLHPALWKSMNLNRGKVPYTSLIEICDHAVAMDELIHGGTKKDAGSSKRKMDTTESSDERKKKSKTSKASGSGAHKKAEGKKSLSQARSKKRDAALKAMQSLPLSEAEKKKMVDEGRCFICKNKGHRAFACPTVKDKKEN
jgi:hypothetical protein